MLKHFNRSEHNESFRHLCLIRSRSVAAETLWSTEKEQSHRAQRIAGAPASPSRPDFQSALAIDGRTTRHEGYAKSIHARRGIEKVFGWIKQWGGLRQFKLRGTVKVNAVFGLHVIAYSLIQLGNLLKLELAAA
jgi:hypothetical protein